MKRCLAIAVAVLACSPPPGDPMDDPDSGSTVQIAPPAAPTDPAPATLTPCPTGWAEVTPASGPKTCEPWALNMGAGCADDAAHFPGESACRTVGTACSSSDDWATALTGTVLYVKLGAASGGTGSRAAPFDTIAAAMTAATAGTTVALSKGVFTEVAHVKAGVTVHGACVAETELRGPAGNGGALACGGLGGAAKNLKVTGAGVGILCNPSSNSISLQDIVIDGTVGVALLVGNRASVTGHDVVFRKTKLAASGTGGRGISAELGGTVTLTRAVFEDNHENAVNVAQTGSKVDLTDVAIRGTLPRGDGAMGRAATVSGGELKLTHAVLEQNTETALLVGGGATFTMTDGLVRATTGDGLIVEGASTATLTRCTLTGNQALETQVRGASTLNASHLVLTNTSVEPVTGADGAGADVVEASHGTIDHAFFGDNHSAGIGVNGSAMTLSDLDIAGTRASRLDESRGLQLMGGAFVQLHRVRVRDSERVGVLIDGAGTTAAGDDLQILDTSCTASAGEYGAGLVVQNGGGAALTRVMISRNKATGVLATDADSSVTLIDAAISSTDSELTSGTFGRGLHVQGGARALLTRVAITHSLDVGLFTGFGSAVQATDLSVDAVDKRACIAVGKCTDLGGSAVVVVGAGAALTAQRFALSHAVQCGLQLAEGGVADLSDGDIAGNPIGACVQTAGFDTTRISSGVAYRNNGRKLDSALVPLPDVMAKKY